TLREVEEARQGLQGGSADRASEHSRHGLLYVTNGDGGLLLVEHGYVVVHALKAVVLVAFGLAACSGQGPTSTPFALCKLYDAASLDAEIAHGLHVNGGCCADHMEGECLPPRSNSTLLVHAIESRRPDVVSALLDRGADVNLGSSSGSPVAVAA